MKIILTDTWSIEGIPLNYVLKHKKLSSGTGKNQGETRMVEVDEGYHTTVTGALKSFEAKYIKEQTEDFEGSVDDYIKRIENIVNNFFTRLEARVKAWESGQDT